MARAAGSTGTFGRQPIDSDAAVQTCVTMKVLFGMARRQTTGFVERLLCLIDPDGDAPDFSRLGRRQKTFAVTIPHRGALGPQPLLIASTGVKVAGKGAWNAHQHGGPQAPSWAQGPSRINAAIPKVRAVEVSSSDRGDAPLRPARFPISLPDRFGGGGAIA